MKKNRMMRAASALLVAVLLTTCTISGTFAKYVTSDNASDEARVAKWGVTITNTEGNVFVKEYAKDDSYYTATNSVISSTQDVVAPGTDMTGLTDLVVNGTPEVAVRVTYEATLALENWTASGSEYCPLVFTVENEDFYIGKTDIDNISDLKDAVEGAIEKCEQEYPANVAITNGEDAPTVSWKWYFDKDADDNPLDTYQDDGKDTLLGNAVTPATIALTVVVTATQID